MGLAAKVLDFTALDELAPREPRKPRNHVRRTNFRVLREIELLLDALDRRPKGPRLNGSWCMSRTGERTENEVWSATGAWVDGHGKPFVMVKQAKTQDGALRALWWELSDEYAQLCAERRALRFVLGPFQQCVEKPKSLYDRLTGYFR